ncbi:Hypothetical protein FKW44_012766 [Caligus rogercresseyi]|uniref:Uncharacterized protein n=1 Tax=Caligus rogercresseyi TaxID=217165 RepID=A0A7T8HK54_CALRO|nr:Hypothetical protein FKW44_012766 [Caligus rogercresseyi]
MQQQEAEDDSMDSISMEQQSVKKRGGTARRHRVGSSTANADSTSHNLENEESVTRKSTRVTRSRPVHKRRKKTPRRYEPWINGSQSPQTRV